MRKRQMQQVSTGLFVSKKDYDSLQEMGGLTKENIKTRAETSDDDVGFFRGYLAVWDKPDSHKTIFKRGSFLPSFQKRGPDGIKLLWYHDLQKPVGKVVNCGEDNYGPWIEGKFNLRTSNGLETYEHVLGSNVRGLSFGFRENTSVRAVYNKQGLKEFGPNSIDVLEASITPFPSQDDAQILDYRAQESNLEYRSIVNYQEEPAPAQDNDKDNKQEQDKVKTRSFNTVRDREQALGGWRLLVNFFTEAMNEAVWDSDDSQERVEAFRRNIDQFQDAILTWLDFYVNFMESDENKERCLDFKNSFQERMHQIVKSYGGISAFCQDTVFSRAIMSSVINNDLQDVPLHCVRSLQDDELLESFQEVVGGARRKVDFRQRSTFFGDVVDSRDDQDINLDVLLDELKNI